MDSLYSQNIIDHYGHPRNEGILDDPDISCERDSPVCGDVVRLDICLKNGRVGETRFSGRGCMISMASASMLTEVMKGKTLAELRTLQKADVFEMLGVTLGPARSNCALLPLKVLQEALISYSGET